MISWIASDFFATSPVLAYAVVALTIQLTVFCGVSLRTLFASKDALQSHSHMPLHDEEDCHE